MRSGEPRKEAHKETTSTATSSRQHEKDASPQESQSDQSDRKPIVDIPDEQEGEDDETATMESDYPKATDQDMDGNAGVLTPTTWRDEHSRDRSRSRDGDDDQDRALCLDEHPCIWDHYTVT